MTGSLYAILAAIAFSLNNVVLRRAVLEISNATLGILISVPMTVPIYFLILALSGQISSIFSFSWQSCVWLALGGTIHFVLGRALHYGCVQLVGANIALMLSRANILVSVVIGITLLHEPISWRLAIGVFFIIIGITLSGTNPQMLRNSSGQLLKIPPKALLLGLGASVAFGISPIFIKLGIGESGAPVAGAFISFSAATFVLLTSLVNTSTRTAISNINGKAAGLFFASGLMSATANLIRFIALGLAPASVVVPIFSSSPVFLLFFSFIFNRKIEIFSKPVAIGVITVVIGTILLI